MKKYWKSLEELKDPKNGSSALEEKEPEFSVEGLSEEEVASKSKASRRDFLKMLGFSVGTAALASSCSFMLSGILLFWFFKKQSHLSPSEILLIKKRDFSIVG